MGKDDWTMKCVIFGAELFKQLSRGQVSKPAARAKIRKVCGELGIAETDYLLKRLQDLVTG